MTKQLATHLRAGNYACGILALAMTAPASLPAQTFNYLYSFGNPNPTQPVALVQSTNGQIYGVANFGTTPANSGGGIFSMTTSGAVTELAEFQQCYADCTSAGFFPTPGMIQGTDGNFYGTMSEGGANSLGGTVFRMTPSGDVTTIYSFCALAGCLDGGSPAAGVVQSTNGNFFGTTDFGGAANLGTVFEVTPEGTLNTIYSFCQLANCQDGSIPFAGLALAPDGIVYGVTGGASYTSGQGPGTAFKVTPGGVFTTIHTFCQTTGCADGEYPAAGLVFATDGNFYGATSAGGTNNAGGIFRMTTSGKVTMLHNFCATVCAEGSVMVSPLVQGTDGNLYGTTTSGGSGYQGTIFSISLSGNYRVLYNFNNPDGTNPSSALIQDTNGVFYGATYSSGTSSDGAIYSLNTWFTPFVTIEPLSSPAGSQVQILGTDLTGATSVTFDGAPAVFTVNPGGTSITATVPAGTKRGDVDVVAPAGTFASFPPFYPLHY